MLNARHFAVISSYHQLDKRISVHPPAPSVARWNIANDIICLRRRLLYYWFVAGQGLVYYLDSIETSLWGCRERTQCTN